MSCNSDIETETVFDVLSVPIQSVTARTDVPSEDDSLKSKDKEPKEENGKEMIGKNKPKEVVFLADNGKAKMVVVETGISDDNYLEIKKGVEEGNEIISGSYRAISRELEDGSIISVDQKLGGEGEDMTENGDNE
jgi:HlyD family secretion protein